MEPELLIESEELEEIGRQVARGFTSGRVDSYDDDDEETGVSVHWKIEMEKFKL